MGCSNQKAVEINEVVKKDENKIENEEVLLNNKEDQEEIELEKQSVYNAPKEEEEQPKEQENNQEIEQEEDKPQLEEMIKNEEKPPEEEEEKKSEEIPEDIDINEEENIEVNVLSNNNDIGSIDKNYEELKGSGNNLKSKSKNKSNNKNKKNLKKKKPFIIIEIQSNPYQKVKIAINACSFIDEYMIPIWCPKNVYIKFRVEGKWRIDKSYDYTDSKGMPSNHSTAFNYGALIGRIGIGDKFVVADETAVLVKKEGPLFLRQYLPKKMKIEPEGKLEISIYDGIYKSIQEINNLIGWKENGTVVQNNENKENNNTERMSSEQKSIKTSNTNSLKKIENGEKELEQNLRKQLNNLRMNPTMFYEKYINFNTNLIKTKKYLDKIEKEEKIPLEDNEICSTFLEDFFKLPNQIQFKKNLNKNNVSENLLKLDEDMGYFLYDQVNRTVRVKSKITQKDNLYEIVLQFLLDKKFRTYIFSSHSQSLSIKVFKNYFSKSKLVIMIIILDKDYSQEEEI